MAELQESDLTRFKSIKINPAFEGLPDFIGLRVVRVDWNDDMLKSKGGVELIALDIEGIQTLGKHALPCLMTGISRQAIAAMIVLAWNLLSPTTLARIYPQVDPTASVDSKKVDEISADVISPTGSTCNIIWPNDPIKCASAITYVCASLLRMITKSAGSYMHAWTHQLKESFQNFYGYEFPIYGLNPNKKCIDDIEFQLKHRELYRNGITGFLYVHEDITMDLGLRRMLFEQHLVYTGMHAFDLFLRVQTALDASTEDLRSVLGHRMIRDAVGTICMILEDFVQNPSENRKRQTWKYARIYDSEYFGQIQTKNCKELVFTLATIIDLMGSEDAGNVLGIVQIRDMSPLMKEYFGKAAVKIVAHFKKQ